MSRQEDVVAKAARKLAAGADFDAVAAEQVGVSDGTKPWDLGFVKWTDVPAPWHDVLAELEPGQVSGVIKGRHLFWVVKLVERRQDPSASYESVKERLLAVLREQKTAAHH
jgi:peptidyl-prolyl cis-trans isomerase SurA